MIKLYTDAASKNNLSSAGILLVHDKKQIQLSQPLAASDNHQAEFQAAIAGFKQALSQFANEETVFFYSDSQLVIDSLNKNYSKHYQELLAELNSLIDSFKLVVWQWVPEKDNKGAHQLALQGLKKLTK